MVWARVRVTEWIKRRIPRRTFTYLEIIVFDRVFVLPTSVEVHLTVWYTGRTSCLSG